jgi:tRNA (cytidine/uridine-2'-O-)-methyltransferase
MLHIALWEPEIPPNTGNIARLCAANGVPLHLIGRLGFRLDDRDLKRAGCDYWPHVECHRHSTFDAFQQAFPRLRVIPLSIHATRTYTEVNYADNDCLLFGSESKGLPQSLRERFSDTIVTIPMITQRVRSLNLATAVGIVLYEALRQRQAW